MPTGPTPSEIRRARRLIAAAMILAWATHLLISQWAMAAQGTDTPVTIVLHDRVEVVGNVVRLEDLGRVEGLEEAGLGRRTVETRPEVGTEAWVGVEQILETLAEAGISPARVHVRGPARCRVTFGSPASPDPEDQDGEWAGIEPDEARPAAARATGHANGPAGEATLDDRLRQTLAERLGVDAGDLELSLRGRDEALASLPARSAQSVVLVRGDDLGRVAWEIEIDGQPRLVTADAALTVQQLIAARPVGRGQTLREGDVTLEAKTIRRLADRTPEPQEAIGQSTARSLSQGDVVASDKLAPRLLVERGQFVVVRVSRGGVEVRLLARAQADGGYGQVIRARNEQTGEPLYLTLTGPQAGVMSQEPAR